MRYSIEENSKGHYLARYSFPADLPEGVKLSEQVKEAVDIISVWDTNTAFYHSLIKVEDELGISVQQLKHMVGEFLVTEGLPADQWIRINILNVM